MSRSGKKPITLPEKTTLVQDGTIITITGPKGSLKRDFDRTNVVISITEKEITLEPKRNDKFTQALWGTYAAHLRNMIEGVNQGYQKKLLLDGVGYKVALVGKNLEMALGFSHPVKVEVPEGLEIKVEKNEVTFSGMDKELVGSFTAKIRALKKPEPYKGKGFRYSNEIIRRKQGKKSV